MGFYGLYSLLLSIAGCLAERAKKGCGKYGVYIAASVSGAGVLLRCEIPQFVLVSGAFVLWVALPIFGSKFPEKKCEKA